MFRARLLLALLLCGMARGAAPAYSAASIINASNYSPGPFAPNSVLSVFGSSLSRSARGLSVEDIRGGFLPNELNSTRVLVDNIPAPLFYVSESQVNFLVPSKQLPGDVRIQLIREGLAGPMITITVVDAAPALFTRPDGLAIATHGDNSLISQDAPARSGEIVVLYATGLGKAVTNPATGELPPYVSSIANLDKLKVLLDGVPVDSSRIAYAGLTPGSAGLYQINFFVPGDCPPDPEIRVAVGSVSSPAGLKLAVK